MKKAFSLFEVVLSITILFIMIFFLYNFLNNTKITNKKFVEKIERNLQEEEIKKIFYEDFIEKSTNIALSKDKNSNNILKFKTSNTFHNVFFTNISYLINEKKQLVRLESKKEIDFTKLNYDSFNDSFIDVLINNVEKFEVVASVKNSHKYLIYIKTDKNSYLFSVNTF